MGMLYNKEWDSKLEYGGIESIDFELRVSSLSIIPDTHTHTHTHTHICTNV